MSATWEAELGPDWEQRLYSAADTAIATNQPVDVGQFLLVPDLLVAEAVANRMRAPDTWRLARPDGRSVNIYRIPEGRR